MALPSCAVPNCNSTCNEQGRLLFRFPLDKPDLLKKWMTAIGDGDLKITISSAICSNHFYATDFFPGSTLLPTLKPKAVPSRFGTSVHRLFLDSFDGKIQLGLPLENIFESFRRTDVVSDVTLTSATGNSDSDLSDVESSRQSVRLRTKRKSRGFLTQPLIQPNEKICQTDSPLCLTCGGNFPLAEVQRALSVSTKQPCIFSCTEERQRTFTILAMLSDKNCQTDINYASVQPLVASVKADLDELTKNNDKLAHEIKNLNVKIKRREKKLDEWAKIIKMTQAFLKVKPTEGCNDSGSETSEDCGDDSGF